MKTIGEIILKAESDYNTGNTKISEHVDHSMKDTLNRIDAYLNSKHISGETDSLGREKPFFNIVTAMVNVWYRSTDIDRSHIKIRATKQKQIINSFFATMYLRQWMIKEKFGKFLNKWGITLSKYGSAVVEIVEKDNLCIDVVPWSKIIVDPIDFYPNPKIKVLHLTEEQLRDRVETNKYDKEAVENLINNKTERDNLNKVKKDTKSDYIKLYEIHGKLSLKLLTGKDSDEKEFVQQMQVISLIGKRTGRKMEYDEYVLYKGREKYDPFYLTHLIEEDDRTLSIGAVEHLFESQWMVNHTMKAIKDNIDLASRMVFQTADTQFLGRNVLSNIENGDILIHEINKPLTQINNQILNTVAQQAFANEWRQLGREINSISEAMLGETPKSGTAWRQTEAILQESHSLFELMIENKALHLEEMLRERIIPYLKNKMDNADEIPVQLEQYEIYNIDSAFIKNEAIKKTNNEVVEKVLNGEIVLPEEQSMIMAENEKKIKNQLKTLGNQRFLSPSEINWKEQFKDMEWDLEIDVSGESSNLRQNLETLDTALKVVVQPGFEQNPKAKAIVGRILEIAGGISPVEYNSLPDATVPQVTGNVASPELSAGELIK